MTKAVAEAIEFLREDAPDSLLALHPYLEAALREAVTEVPTDERGEVSFGILRAKYGTDGLLEVKSRKLKNVILNWPILVEFVVERGAEVAGGTDAGYETHPGAYASRLVLKTLQKLAGARDLDLGPASAEIVRQLWILRKGENTVKVKDLAKDLKVTMPKLSKKDLDNILENLTALGIVKLERKTILKCEKFILVAG